MDTDLNGVEDSILSDHSSFNDHREALSSLDGDILEQKRLNSIKFIDMALDSLHEHFKRWTTPLFPPAALMTEPPLANIAADVIVDIPQPEDSVCDVLPYKSSVHKRWIDLVSFHSWLSCQCDDDDVDEESLACQRGQAAAANVLDGEDMRCPTAANVQTSVPQKWLWWRFLPLPSQTHFVEAGAKECKLVSSTGRGEETRSSCAIIGSSVLHNMGGIRDVKPNERLKNTVEAIDKHTALQKELAQSPAHVQNLKNMRSHLHKDHFKHERMEKKKEAIKETATTNRKENKRQKTSGADQTAVASGRVAFSAVLAKHKGFSEKAKKELIARGVDISGCKTFTSLKDALKKDELKRVTSGENYSVAEESEQKKMVAMAKKAFLARQSDECFDVPE